MKEKIDKFLVYFTTITKEECDYIESILKWDDQTRAAFFFAKRIFEEDGEKKDTVRDSKRERTDRLP